MCNALVENSIEVDLAVPQSDMLVEDATLYLKKRFGIQINFKIIFYKREYKNSKFEKYFAYKSVRMLLSNSNADFVILRIPKYIKTVLSSGKKLIFESHNSLLHDKIPIINNYWKWRILKQVKDKNFVLFISISENLAKFWKKLGVPSSKSITLHDGFSMEKYLIIPNKEKIRKQLNIPTNDKVVMYVGSLYPDRNIDNILEAAREIPNFIFYIIGGPEKYQQYYLKKVREMELLNVRLLGYVSHSKVPSYLFSADILLALWSRKVPTIDYCSPLKLFEYMASGKIILAHDFITIREVLSHNIDAILIDPDNPQSLSQALSNIDVLNSSMGILARKKVFEYYSWKTRAKLIINNLKTLN